MTSPPKKVLDGVFKLVSKADVGKLFKVEDALDEMDGVFSTAALCLAGHKAAGHISAEDSDFLWGTLLSRRILFALDKQLSGFEKVEFKSTASIHAAFAVALQELLPKGVKLAGCPWLTVDSAPAASAPCEAASRLPVSASQAADPTYAAASLGMSLGKLVVESKHPKDVFEITHMGSDVTLLERTLFRDAVTVKIPIETFTKGFSLFKGVLQRELAVSTQPFGKLMYTHDVQKALVFQAMAAFSDITDNKKTDMVTYYAFPKELRAARAFEEPGALRLYPMTTLQNLKVLKKQDPSQFTVTIFKGGEKVHDIGVSQPHCLAASLKEDKETLKDFKPDEEFVEPFWWVGTTADFAEVNMLVEHVEYQIEGGHLSIPTMVNVAPIKQHDVLLRLKTTISSQSLKSKHGVHIPAATEGVAPAVAATEAVAPTVAATAKGRG